MRGAALAACLAVLPAWGSQAFLDDLHRAERRSIDDDEKVEYYNRAISAWTREDGTSLLANCHFRRGETYFHHYEFDEAEPDLRRTLELDPRNGQAYLLLGRIRLRRGRWQDAAKDFAAFSALAPDNPEGPLFEGDAHRLGGRLEAALKDYARAKEREPSDFRAPLGTARVRMAKKDWEEALARLAEAARLAGGPDPDVLTEGAVCEVALGRPEKALPRYDAAIPILVRRLENLDRADAYPPAVEESQEAAAKAYFGRGRVREFLVKLAEALEDYQEACRLGHREACSRAAALAARPELRTVKARPEETAKPEAKPRKARRRWLPRPSSESGERIYAQ